MGRQLEMCEADAMEIGVRAGWIDAVEAQFGSAPWWLVSAVFHMVVLAVLGLIVVSQPVQEEGEVIRVSYNDREEMPEPPMTPEAALTEQNLVHPDPVVQELTFVPVEEIDDTEDLFETENNSDDGTARGNPDEVSDMPMHGKGEVGNIGVSGMTGGHMGDPLGRGQRRRRRRHWRRPTGPTPLSEQGVDRALKWLALHQEPDGHWDGAKYEGRKTDVALTGLALLAFQGAGHTERSGKYRGTVRRGVAWLIKKQDADGSIGKGYEGGLGYHHAIAGLALAESFGMARVPRTGLAAQKAATYSVRKHQKEYSGWRYSPAQNGDMSVTGWFVMQLKSARVAGLRADGQGFKGAMAFLEKCTKLDGEYGGRVSYTPGGAPTPTMTAVGAVSRLFMGVKPNDPLVIGAARNLAENTPRWDGERGGVNFYYWYYGALAMFQVGGDFWRAWNVAMRDMLVEHQRAGGPDVDGSWDPVGQWCGRGGRVFSTAMAALCLEVYYRHEVMSKK